MTVELALKLLGMDEDLSLAANAIAAVETQADAIEDAPTQSACATARSILSDIRNRLRSRVREARDLVGKAVATDDLPF